MLPESVIQPDGAGRPVRIYTCGRFGVVINGSPLRFTRKVQKKPLDLLKAIIAFGGRDISEQQLTAALWPDSGTNSAHLCFKTNIHRLRHMLGNEHIVVVQEGRVSLDTRYCWIDVWAFERILGQAKKAGAASAALLTGQAVALYGGHFLETDCNEPWTVSLREHLRCLYVRAIVRLGAYHEQAGVLDRAIECYEDGLRVDDLEEEFYQRLIACHLRAGRKAEAIRTCQRCCSVLTACLGVGPSPETRELCRDSQKEPA